MKILDRYIGRAVAGGILTVMSVLLALYTFFTFLNEAERVGEGNYTVLEAFRYVIFTLPRHVYELFPVTSLLGTMLGLGTLSAGSEITVIRAAGVSLARIGLAVMRVGVVINRPV